MKFKEKYDEQLREVNHFSSSVWKERIKKMTNDGEWTTEIELLVFAAFLDPQIWTFFNGCWIRYRPSYTIGKDLPQLSVIKGLVRLTVSIRKKIMDTP